MSQSDRIGAVEDHVAATSDHAGHGLAHHARLLEQLGYSPCPQSTQAYKRRARRPLKGRTDDFGSARRSEQARLRIDPAVRRSPSTLDALPQMGAPSARALSAAGHEVTGLDISAELLDRFGAALTAEPPDLRGILSRYVS